MPLTYVFLPDCAGGSGVNPTVQSMGTITCLAPKGAHPMSVQDHTRTFSVMSPTGVYAKYNNRFPEADH